MCPVPLLPCPVAAGAAASPAMLPPLPPHSLLLPVADSYPVAAGTPPMSPLPSSFDDDDDAMPAFIPIPLTVMEAMMRSGTTANCASAALPPLPLPEHSDRLCRAPLITNPAAVRPTVSPPSQNVPRPPPRRRLPPL
ncbi:hypothetical protein GGF32_008846 [Allomyces javanicus]|nr:hypothetical protein GGF32_008846 [Allomyces javanicus]